MIHYLVKGSRKECEPVDEYRPSTRRKLPEVAVQRLKEMGEWMNQYGETIYGTVAVQLSPHDLGVTTQKRKQAVCIFSDLQGIKPCSPFEIREGEEDSTV